MKAPAILWIFRALWLALPFTLLTHLTQPTDGASNLGTATTVLFWVLWSAALLCSLIPLPSMLTALRIIAPMAPVAAVVASVQSQDLVALSAIVLSTLAAAVALASALGDWFIDGASYGAERRFGLRPPAALLIGPLQLTWVVTVGPLLCGVLLLATSRWIAGGILAVLGLPLSWWGSMVSWRLARRWAVVVPAGVTLVDALALSEPILLRSKDLALGPAHVDSDATDLTAGAAGLVLSGDLSTPVEVTPAAKGRNDVVEASATSAVLFVPSRPGSLLTYCEQQGITVRRT